VYVIPAKAYTRQYGPVMRSLAVWARRSRWLTEPVTRYEREGKVQVTTWQGGANGADMMLYTLEGWGHHWPGPCFTAQLDARDPLSDFDTARIIRDFFKGRTR